VYYLQLATTQNPDCVGVGEVAPLLGLSPDARPDLETAIQDLCQRLRGINAPKSIDEVYVLAKELVNNDWPALRFGLEVALLDWLNGGQRLIFDTPFAQGKEGLLTNGLVWMNTLSEMYQQAQDKIALGFECVKMKIGALDFEQECGLLAALRQTHSPDRLTLRVDANGAFSPQEAEAKLQRLAQYQLHSIEQPIMAGQLADMARLCRTSPVPIALDEELIVHRTTEAKQNLLMQVQPAFIILKPTLVGGLAQTAEWIQLAQAQNIGWWITSALESNIGLNAIAQFCATYQPTLPQGLGTGGLYHNNLEAPLSLQNQHLYYNPNKEWQNLTQLVSYSN
jgi:o-succinylbenzoate synthase